MKKVFSVVAIAAFAVASMSSCKKCGTCNFQGSNTLAESCGTSSEIDNLKNACSQAGGTWESK
jgi:hypothetical protein